ncbi:Uncharacterized protein TCM_037056 [Theobroma cacao]|uniref:Uncharacterized protein n=1 Tax=Theobroma cacao TaxID=3641 RepID=A0A061GQZ6_THECC|nr:Uncharacterized protein TCM_037056 [Theobroma cacao]
MKLCMKEEVVCFLLAQTQKKNSNCLLLEFSSPACLGQWPAWNRYTKLIAIVFLGKYICPTGQKTNGFALVF